MTVRDTTGCKRTLSNAGVSVNVQRVKVRPFDIGNNNRDHT